MNVKKMLYAILQKFKAREQLIKQVEIHSPTISFVQNRAISTDLSVPNQDGYTFLTWINPRGIGVIGSFYMTITLQSTCRIWSIPASTVDAEVGAVAVFIKDEYA